MQNRWRYVIFCLVFVTVSGVCHGQAGNYIKLNFVCLPTNDLYRLLLSAGQPMERYETVELAVESLESGSSLFVLADRYPVEPLEFSEEVVDKLAGKKILVYAEFVASWRGKDLGQRAQAGDMRVAVTDGSLEPYVARNTLLAMHNFTYIPIPYPQTIMTGGPLAGFTTFTGRLPKWENPQHGKAEFFTILGKESLRSNVLAATKLSNFMTGRYEPIQQWGQVWQGIIKQVTGYEIEMPPIPAMVKPAFGVEATLPEDLTAQALQRGVEWYYTSKLFVHPEWEKKVAAGAKSESKLAPWPGLNAQNGDGTLGILEGFGSLIDPMGSNMVSCSRRTDSVGESAMALAFGASVLHDDRSRKAAENLLGFLFKQDASVDASGPAYGLIRWSEEGGDGGVYDADGNGRTLLAAITASSLLSSGSWNEQLALGLLANLRVTGKSGFRAAVITQDALSEQGWQQFADTVTSEGYPHCQSSLWACYLWAYGKTGYGPFLERAKSGMSLLMALYQDGWRWAGGIQQERARMLLPLAWLVRVEDKPEHRDWLKRIAGDLVARQDACGAITEEIGIPGGGLLASAEDESYARSNDVVIHKNGDKAADLLYTVNHALVGLHEAAAATGDELYRTAELKLRDFICRTQVKSILHPELDGTWFRSFDYGNWSYWGCDVHPRWGAWSAATGGTHGWITSVLAMIEGKTNLWETAGKTDIKAEFEKLSPTFFSGQAPGNAE